MTLENLKPPLWQRLTAVLQSPLLRNGYALVFNSVATAALGMVYWLAAANLYSAEVIGVNAALINAMLFLAQAAQLNLTNGVNRFLPSAGSRSSRFVQLVYLIILGAAPLVCLVYFVGINSWAPLLAAQFADSFVVLGFVLATMAWCIFAMQDSVLIGLRRATWVPLENLLFATAKIVLLIVSATTMPHFGVFFSWVVPMVVLLLPVNWLIFRHFIPKHVEATAPIGEALSVTTVARYVAGDYLGSLLWTATIGLLPMLILERTDATTAAYFAIAWTIAYSLYLVSRNMGMSLITEASLDPDKLTLYSQRTFRQTFKLLTPVTLLVVLAAPWLLRLFGKEYSTEATMVLRLLALSALPAAVTTIYLSAARVQRKVMRVFAVQVALCGLVWLLSLILLEQMGISGVGWAWLVGQTAIAGVLLMSGFGLNYKMNHQGTKFTKVTQRIAKIFEFLRESFAFFVVSWLKMIFRIRSLTLIQMIRCQRHHWSLFWARRKIARLQPTIAAIVQTLTTQSGSDDWQVLQIIPTLADVTVVALGSRVGDVRAMLKFPDSKIAVRYSLQQQKTLTALQADTALGDWRKLIPTLLTSSEKNSQHFAVESLLPGVAMDGLIDGSNGTELRLHLLPAAASTIRHLHQRTAQPLLVEATLIDQWVGQPIAQLQTLYGSWRGAPIKAALTRLGHTLQKELIGKTLAVGWSHGDFAPCNILVAENPLRVTGIVDWEQARPNDLPLLDLVFLLLSTRTQVEAKELGSVVVDLLGNGQWSKAEQTLLDQAQNQLAGERLSQHSLILLTWLRHVSMTIDKSQRYRRHPLWRRNNIDRVLQGL